MMHAPTCRQVLPRSWFDDALGGPYMPQESMHQLDISERLGRDFNGVFGGEFSCMAIGRSQLARHMQIGMRSWL
jgi:hypothetical protein